MAQKFGGKKRVKRPKPKFPPKFMVWGAFGYRGKSCLKVVAGKMDSTAYVNILEECLVNDMSILFSRRVDISTRQCEYSHFSVYEIMVRKQENLPN
jgi:hypothetical protein